MKEKMIQHLKEIGELLPQYISLIESVDEKKNETFFILEGVDTRKFLVHIQTHLDKSKPSKP